MKDYRIAKKGDYITTISSNTLSDGTETFDVKFADGRIFKNVLCNKNNLQKIVEQQDKQAEEGIELLPVLKKKLTRQGIIAGCTGILSGISGCEIVHSIQTDESIVIPLTNKITRITNKVGIITLLSFSIPPETPFITINATRAMNIAGNISAP